MCFLPILILQNNEVSLHNFTVILKKGTVPVNNTNLPTAQVGVLTTAKQYLCVTSNWVTKSGNLIKGNHIEVNSRVLIFVVYRP